MISKYSSTKSDGSVGIYLHVPFCKSRCAYCDFFSSTLGREARTAYVDRLCREIGYRSHSAEGRRVATIYWGGGTPSVLTSRERERVFEVISDRYAVEGNAEITLEANPDDVDGDFARSLAASPVNRVSMGVQTFDDNILRTIGRRHSSRQAIEAIDSLLQNGLENISIDLIYGLPGQTRQGWESDLSKALSLPITHLSAYTLMYEEGTLMTKWRDEGRIAETDDEEIISMYNLLTERCRREGFEHYEISNFAKSGFRSRHNSSYWHGIPYLGFGPGAHSYDGRRRRRSNDCDIRSYVSSVGDVPHHVEVISDDELYDEMVMTSLRTAEGIDLTEVEDIYGKGCRDSLLQIAHRYLDSGTLVMERNRLFFSEAGFLLSDMVMADLMKI